MAARDMLTGHRSAGLAYATMGGPHTVSHAATRARFAVWRFTHASRGEAARTILRCKVAPLVSAFEALLWPCATCSLATALLGVRTRPWAALTP